MPLALSLAYLAALASRQGEPQIKFRTDDYGVTLVQAGSVGDAYYGMGKQLAQDRLWQMEMERRSSRGELAEVLGEKALASDKEVLKRAYTDDELTEMLAALPGAVQEAFKRYTDGVNAGIQARIGANQLPKHYADYGFMPGPWTVLDSCAIVVNLSRQFGAGGAGELRNLTLLRYLASQPAKAHALDVFDDLVWRNEPDSPTTVSNGDDPVKNPPAFPNPTRQQTESQLAALPKTSVFELLGAVAQAGFQESRALAENLGVAHKVGSYAVVVCPKRSASGNPLLLGAPQMGHTVPSVIHEIALQGGGMEVAGMDVPGIPGILIGNNASVAWTLTSGVADVEDIVVSKLIDADTYEHHGAAAPLQHVKFTIKVKGKPDVTVIQDRTAYGPVLLKSADSKAIYSLRSTLWKHELSTSVGALAMATSKTPADVAASVASTATTFNLFYATTGGDIGWRYVGQVPVRNLSIDPRLPAVDEPGNKFEWSGFIPLDQMPHVENPSGGLIFNWNNKPVSWWANGDTPVWGSIFRSSVLGKSLVQPSLSMRNVEQAAWDIARQETSTNGVFGPEIQAMIRRTAKGPSLTEPERQMLAYDGWELDGSIPTTIYRAVVGQLRRELFIKAIGNLTSESLFQQGVQPSVIAKALDGKTKYDYRAGRSRDSILRAAFDKAVESLETRLGKDVLTWRLAASRFPVGGGLEDVQYANRGTYMQVTELGALPFGRNVVVPGVAESGPFSTNQVELSRTWTYKSMWRPGAFPAPGP